MGDIAFHSSLLGRDSAMSGMVGMLSNSGYLRTNTILWEMAYEWKCITEKRITLKYMAKISGILLIIQYVRLWLGNDVPSLTENLASLNEY